MSADSNDVPFRLEPIERIETFRSAFAQLSSLVERMQPGDRLDSERQVAEQLQVSRVTVREVLRALQGMGQVDIRRSSGTFVARPVPHSLVRVSVPTRVDDGYIRQLSETRAGIECQVVRLLGQRHPVDLTAAEAALTRAEQELEQEPQQGSLDSSFEGALGQATGNAVIAEFQHAIHELWLGAWITLGGAIANRRHLHEEHLSIFEALKMGHYDIAEQRMRSHITGLGPPEERLPKEH